jgi:hypothetical protein
MRRLADVYGVTHQTIAQVLDGTIWSHATGIERRV